MAKGTSAHDIQHLFYAAAADPRIFQTGKVVPRVMTRSQEFGQSGSRYPSDSVLNSEWSEAALNGGFDLGDLVLLLASMFSSKRETNGDWKFLALAGGRKTGYAAPKQWTKMLSYNWADSGETYEAADAILQQLEVNYDRSADTMVTGAFLAKQYRKITRPTTAPVPSAVDTNIIRNSDIRIGLSAGRLGEVAYPTELLRARWSYPQIVVPVFGGNQSDRGWTHFVEADNEGGFAPRLNLTFMENSAYLNYAERDKQVFVTLGDAAGNLEWIHLARWVEQPAGPGNAGNVQEVEISFVPVARVDGRALADLQIDFTAATSGDLTGFRTTATAIGSSLSTEAGYRPTALTEVLYNNASGEKNVTVGTADAAAENWPQSWEPASVRFASAGTEYPLTYDATTRKWQTEAIASPPISAGNNKSVFIRWKWTPATFMSGVLKGTNIAALV